MNMTNNEKQLICLKVGEYFLRVIKNHNYYLTFRKTFLNSHNIGRKSMLGAFYHGDKKDSPYLKTIFKISEAVDREYESHRHNDSAYEYITIFINMMLRQYLENGGVDPRKLGMLGQELFDLSCYSVYGDKYLTDMEEMNRQNGGMRAPRNEKEAWLMAEFEHRIRNGEHLDFETFMRERTSVPDEEFWNRYNGGFQEDIDENDDDIYDEEDGDDFYDEYEENDD